MNLCCQSETKHSTSAQSFHFHNDTLSINTDFDVSPCFVYASSLQTRVRLREILTRWNNWQGILPVHVLESVAWRLSSYCSSMDSNLTWSACNTLSLLSVCLCLYRVTTFWLSCGWAQCVCHTPGESTSWKLLSRPTPHTVDASMRHAAFFNKSSSNKSWSGSMCEDWCGHRLSWGNKACTVQHVLHVVRVKARGATKAMGEAVLTEKAENWWPDMKRKPAKTRPTYYYEFMNFEPFKCLSCLVSDTDMCYRASTVTYKCKAFMMRNIGQRSLW